MDERDTFQIVKFSDHMERMSPQPVSASPANIQKALHYIDSLQSEHGTMLVDGLRASLDFSHDESRLRFVLFLTDGYIGNESEVLRELHNRLGPARIFSFGVGSSPNRYLMDHMAKMGRGAAAYLTFNDSAEDVMQFFFERVSHPAMTDITIDWSGMNVTEIYPRQIPDLFVGRPVILSGRFSGAGTTEIKIRGRIGGKVNEMMVPVNLTDSDANNPAIASVWARAKVADLAERAIYETNNELSQQVRQVALEHGLTSPFTAFLAVDSSTRTAGESGATVNIPVPVPDGVKHETTVGGGETGK
jgi:Ca-activated chloride channel homolog